MIPRLDLSALQERTKHVSILKIGLLAFATLIVLSVVLWPRFKMWMYPGSALFEKEIVRPVNTATKPNFNGVDSHNQPYKIVAEFGQQISPEEMEFDNPTMTLYLKSGGQVILSATKGNFFKGEKKIKLTGIVSLKHSDGYILNTTFAWIDCNEGTAFGDHPVDGDGPTGIIHSRGFQLTDHGDKVVFLGQPELFLCTKKK